MVVHLCCSVDAGYFLTRLQETYPQETLIGFFYDPNIHPYSEYYLRMLDTKRICEKLGIAFFEGDYDYEYWYKSVKGHENADEKGSRCSLCFDVSLFEAARFACKKEIPTITTSLLMSPMKSASQLQAIGEKIKKSYAIEFLNLNFRDKGGHQSQQRMAKETQMYRQDYCGCLYGLTKQREKRDAFLDELLSPITRQILPGSIEERIEIYEKRLELEKEKKTYRILKENFLNYRLLSATVLIAKKVVPSYILYYSVLERSNGGRIEYEKEGVFRLNRMQITFIELSTFNRLSHQNYDCVYNIIQNPLTIKKEIEIRNKLMHGAYDLTPIIVLETVPKESRIEVSIDSRIYSDKRDVLVIDESENS